MRAMWHLVKEVVPELDHVFVVLLVEAALQEVVVGQGAETVVLGRLEEPVRSLREVLLGIVDIAQRVVGRGRIVRILQAADAEEQRLGAVPFAGAIGAVAQFVGVFRLLGRLDVPGLQQGELRQGFLVPLMVEEVQGPEVPHLGRQHMLRVCFQERFRQRIGIVRLEPEGAEGPVGPGCRGVAGIYLVDDLGVHSGFI